MLNGCLSTASRCEIGMPMQRSKGMDGSRVLLREYENFANLCSKLYRVSLRAARDANWVYFIPDRGPASYCGERWR